MAYEIINEKVKMMASFDNGTCLPVIFKWKNRNYKIAKVNLAYQEREGRSINYYYSVETDTGGVFKLRYNDEKLIWWLEEYWVE
jgi:hypothetical protein